MSSNGEGKFIIEINNKFFNNFAKDDEIKDNLVSFLLYGNKGKKEAKT